MSFGTLSALAGGRGFEAVGGVGLGRESVRWYWLAVLGPACLTVGFGGG